MTPAVQEQLEDTCNKRGFHETVASPGVDFVFDKDAGLLSIQVRYIRVDASDGIILRTLGLTPLESNQRTNNWV